MGRQVPGSALYRPDNPVENVLATDAVAVDIATQGIGIEPFRMGVPVGESVTLPRGEARRRDSNRFQTA